MKRCPKCALTLTDDNDFCPEDGTRLLMDSGNQVFGGFQTSGEMPTQFVPSSQAVAAPSSTGSSPILYLFIGVLATALTAVGVYSLLLRDDSKKSEIAVSNAPQASSTVKPSPSIPSVSTASAPLTIYPGTAEQIRSDVTDRILAWKATSEAHDLDGHMRMYASSVDYYKRRAASRAVIRADKQRAHSKFDSIRINVNVININSDPSGEKVEAIIDKEWVFQGGGYFAGKVRQRLQFIKVNGEWLISGEQDQKVFYINR
jgi:hypothetical protein